MTNDKLLHIKSSELCLEETDTFLKGEGMNVRQARKLTKSTLNMAYSPGTRLRSLYRTEPLVNLIYPLSLQLSG